MRLLLASLGAALAGVVLWFWDSSPPQILWSTPPTVGNDFELRLAIRDAGKGIRGIEVRVRQAGAERAVLSRAQAATWLPWQRSAAAEDLTLSQRQIAESGGPLEEGPFDVAVRVWDQPNLWFFSRDVLEVRSFELDTKPPRVEVLSSQHYLRQGGAEAVLYRISEDAVASGARVGENLFPGVPAPGWGQNIHIALFALAHDQAPDSEIALWAEDAAGNRAESRFWCKTFPRRFRSRRIDVSDSFIQAVASEILSRTSEVQAKDSPDQTFLELNDRLRKLTDARIREITSESARELLWSEPFLQLSNSKVESAFADHRSYFYGDRKIDEQTHLGFDLASLARSPVEAANDGVVVFADYLGIYGNCVILDHGLGLFSLYGHLSSIEVESGRRVSRGDVLGRTGETGLAAGDHLHFSMLLRGVQVSPMEWWDPKWVREHLLEKLAPPAGDGPPSPGAGASPARPGLPGRL